MGPPDTVAMSEDGQEAAAATKENLGQFPMLRMLGHCGVGLESENMAAVEVAWVDKEGGLRYAR